MSPCPFPPSRTRIAPVCSTPEPALAERHPRPGSHRWSVVWARGQGCPELADLLADGTARRAGPDLRTSCIEARADLLVTRRLTSFDLIPVAVPRGFDPPSVRGVVAAVAGGPHSLLAARVAASLGRALGVPTSLVTVSPDADSDDVAEAALGRAAALVPVPERRVVRAANPGAAVRALPPGALLVLGAPGGTWWRRQFSGPGPRLQAAAPAGTIVVRTAPRRCFHDMIEPAAIGGQMPAGEALRLTTEAVVPIAEEGRLIGLVRRRAMEAADPATPLASLMEAPISARPDDRWEEAVPLWESLEGAPVPLVDADGRLCGLLPLSPPARAR
jgi:CBS domain-containing protein